ncbi:KilA-N domain-containing protein [Candidatus Pantoea multigeneris]|uniref:KilA-N domain-containing protein n=1 Tax=Candidatus Pantoea multigeneris TaxID=2608357 RepID=A0ABX0R8B1_9GAMM|nr:KilA-N domain-containing protein [Pantoea multigeneris]NIF20597.1 KilA-N domain-containing protein [Pantoea multigeneris]
MNLVIDSVPVRQDNAGRYCLNDLHKAAGAERRNDPHDWLRLKQTKEVVDLLSDTGIPVTVVKGGSNQGTFVCKELVYSYAMWISPAFNLKVIRTFDALISQGSSSNPVVADRIQAGVILLESASKLLNLSNSSKLGAFQKLQQVAGLPNLMPSYAIDAPADAVDGSSRPTQSLSALLKANGMRVTANSVYHQLVRLGIAEHKTRNSKSGPGGVKSFWSLTSKGCLYGKNITSPANPRETQPHFFESKFPELLRLLDNVC